MIAKCNVCGEDIECGDDVTPEDGPFSHGVLWDCVKYLKETAARLRSQRNEVAANLIEKGQEYGELWQEVDRLRNGGKEPYEMRPYDDETCPICGNPVDLLCPVKFGPELPAFYVCTRRHITQIGVGLVKLGW